MKQTQEYKTGGQAAAHDSTIRVIGNPQLTRPASLGTRFEGFDFEDFKRFARDVARLQVEAR